MGNIAQHGACPHYEERLTVISKHIEHKATPFVFYRPDKNYSSNHFVTIIADPETILPWTNRVSWKFVRESLEETGKRIQNKDRRG